MGLMTKINKQFLKVSLFIEQKMEKRLKTNTNQKCVEKEALMNMKEMKTEKRKKRIVGFDAQKSCSVRG